MTPVRVITIAREYGSGGAAIGRELARRLGWKLLDRELILELARRAHLHPCKVSEMDERATSFVERLLKSLWLSSIATWSGPAPDIIDPDYIAKLSGMLIREAAKLGKYVIVGRGGQCALQDNDDVFHVFVYGSQHQRLKRVQSRYLTKAECEAALDEIDRTRAAYIRTHYGCDWASRQL
jgi:cytidylate kinase